MTTEPSQHERIQADSILTCREVCSRVGMSRMHVHNLIARGQFPKPFKLYEGGRNNGWLSKSSWTAMYFHLASFAGVINGN